MASTKNIQMEITVPSNDYQRIVDSDKSGNSVETFRKLAEYFFHTYANGGLLLKPQDVSRLSKSIGKTVSGPEDLILAIEKANNNEDGQSVYKLILDPAALEPYKEYAKFQGLTLEEFVQDCFLQIVDNGWLYNIDLSTRLIALTKEDHDAISDFLGKKVFTGADIAKAMKSQLEVK